MSGEIDAFVADLARREESLSVARILERVERRFGPRDDPRLKERVRETVLRVRVRRARRRSIVLGSVATAVGAGFLGAAVWLLFPLGAGSLPAQGIKLPIVLALSGFAILGWGLRLLITGRTGGDPLAGGPG